MSFAFGGGVNNFVYHSHNMGTYRFGFPNGYQGTLDILRDSRIPKQIHGWVLFLSWGIFADLGIMATRHFRHKGKYLEIHTILFWIVDFLNLANLLFAVFGVILY